MTKLAVTTAVRPSEILTAQAQSLARELNAPFATRGDASIAQIFAATHASRLLVCEGNGRLRLRDFATRADYAFHPNMALIRALTLERGDRDVFADAMQLAPGESLLDATLGFASEAALAALLVGETGRVVGLESVPELAAVTRAGIQNFPLPSQPRLEAALRRIEVVTESYKIFLQNSPDSAFDVVYFDPFFPERLPGSESSVSPLHVFGNPDSLDAASVLEARRVARKRVVVKRPKHEKTLAELENLPSKIVFSRKSKVEYWVMEK